MIYASAAIIAAQALDSLTFFVMVARRGIVAEAMPSVQLVYTTTGPEGIIIAKVALVILVLSAVVAMRRANEGRLATLLVIFATLAGIVGGVSNILSL